MDAFKTHISVFESYKSQPKQTTLAEWLQMCRDGCQYSEQVLEYRRTGNSITKKSLPLITVGCRLTGEKDADKHPDPGTGYRVPEQIAERTGWISLDIDSKDNPHIESAEALRDELKKIVFVAFAGLSTGGRGVWALVKASNPKRQAEHFEQLRGDFSSIGITLDSTKGKNPHDARFYSFDPDLWHRDDFKVYDRLPKPQPVRTKRRSATNFSGNVFDFAMQKVKDKYGYTFTHPGDMHYSIFQFCSVLNWLGVTKEEAENWINSNLLSLSEIRSNCITGAYDTPDAKRHFGAGKREYSAGAYPASAKDRKPQPKYESEKSAPFGVNPYTGEIFDERGYPADWDEQGETETLHYELTT